MWLDRRVMAEEWMDDPGQSEADFAAALVDLEKLNRWSFGYRPTLAFLDRLVTRTGATQLSVLDVGAGGGDMLRAVARWGERRGIAVSLTGLDRSPWAGRFARAAGTPGDWIEADLFSLDPQRRFDVVLCALFTHHLPDPLLVQFLRWIEARATRGWMINDLHRHWVPWVVVAGGTRLLRMHPMVSHDGPVSIARAFSRADWMRLLGEAGVSAELRWSFPFRWSVSHG